MKLSVDIIYQNLKPVLPVTMYGNGTDRLTLLRPEFYLEGSRRFEADHVYVCSADHLPADPEAEPGAVLICLGDAPQLLSYRDRCCILSMTQDLNIFEVFNIVQEVFNRYESWEDRINAISRNSASLQELLDASRDIFENPMLLNGAQFNYLAYTDEAYLEEHMGMRFDSPSIDADLIARFLSLHDVATDIREPLRMDLLGRQTLSVNLFDLDEYLGCLTVFAEFRPLRPSDTELCVFLTQILKQAIQRNPQIAGDRSAVRTALRALSEGKPLTSEQRRHIGRRNERAPFVCACFRPDGNHPALPGAYLASLIEQAFRHAFAFEHETDVYAVLPSASSDALEMKKSLSGPLRPFLAKTQVHCGVSQPFSDLADAGYAFFQSTSALRGGPASRAQGPLRFFDDCILDQLIDGAFRGIPARWFYSAGLMRLKEHDRQAQVSYLETLRTYLDCSLSLSRTSQALFIHRSSLIDRLGRIRQITGFDLTDPDTRLTLQLVLRAEQLQQELPIAGL